MNKRGNTRSHIEHLRRRRYGYIAAFSLALAGIILFLPSKPDPQAGLPRQMTGIDERLAPDFRLPKFGGGEAGISSYLGKVIVLDFWATWCAPCKAEIPDFIEMQEKYGKAGLQIIGVALDERAAVERFVPGMKMNYPILFGNETVSALYGGISGLPTTFIIDREGKIVTSFQGFQQKSVFESEIKKLL